MERLERVREALSELALRLARGELDETTHDRLVERVCAGLPVEERVRLGLTPTPPPVTPGPSPRPSPRVGPSGLRTKPPHLSELDLAPGAVLFDKFRIVRELGRGGFGAVFEAERVGLGKTYAVKVLDPSMVVREELLARFRREVIVMQGLVHPHIGRVFDYDERTEEGLALFAMEFIQGCTVRDLVQTAKNAKQPVPIELALAILGQTLEALAEAHAQGVIHRDVTPGNILLAGGSAEQLLEGDRDPQVKLVDFGIAGLVDRSELSQKSRVLGVPAYIAPEVIDPTQPVTAAADVYGAGAVAYELLTGVLPFGRFPMPSEIRKELVGEVEELLLAMLDVRPNARPDAEQAGKGAASLAARARAAIRAERAEQAQRERDAGEARRRAKAEREQAEAERARLEQERREAEERTAQEAERRWRQQRDELLERFERQVGSGDPEQIGAAEATLAELSSHCAGRVTSDVDLEALRQALEQSRRDWLAERGALIEAAQHAGDMQEVRRLLGAVGAIDDLFSRKTVNFIVVAPWLVPAKRWLDEREREHRDAERVKKEADERRTQQSGQDRQTAAGVRSRLDAAERLSQELETSFRIRQTLRPRGGTEEQAGRRRERGTRAGRERENVEQPQTEVQRASLVNQLKSRLEIGVNIPDIPWQPVGIVLALTLGFGIWATVKYNDRGWVFTPPPAPTAVPKESPIVVPSPTVQPLLARVRVTSHAHGVRVNVDGKPHGTAPVWVELKPGRHLLTVHAKGCSEAEELVEVAAGEQRELPLDPVCVASASKPTLAEVLASTPADVPVPTATPPSPMTLLRIVTARPDATIRVDGEVLTDLSGHPIDRTLMSVTPGTHQVQFEAPGCEKQVLQVTVAQGETKELKLLEPCTVPTATEAPTGENQPTNAQAVGVGQCQSQLVSVSASSRPSISGVVRDSTGNALPGVVVSAHLVFVDTHGQHLRVKSTVTGTGGHFSVPIGGDRCAVQFSLAGFKRFIIDINNVKNGAEVVVELSLGQGSCVADLGTGR